MEKRRLFALLFLPAAVVSAVFYMMFAAYNVKWTLMPPDNVGFGPHVMSWSFVIPLCIRAIVGLALVSCLFMIIRRQFRWLTAALACLLLLNGYNLHSLLQYVPEARQSNASVFEFFPSLMIADYALHFLAFVAVSALVLASIRDSRL